MFRRKEDNYDPSKPASSPYGESGLSSFTKVANVQPASDSVQPMEEQESAHMANKQQITKSPFETVRQFPDKVFKPGDIVRKADDLRPVTQNPVRGSAMDKGEKSAKRVMTVGQDTFLKGEISTCDKVIVEGQIDAKMTEVASLEITETGSFKGSAVIEDAEISGLFEGDITVKGRLMIYSTGRITGKIRYGEIEIQRGGRISGEIRAYDEAELPAKKSHSKVSHRNNNYDTSEQQADKSEFSGTISELFSS